MGDTSISWTDKSWNPGQGCSRISTGCERCYAERLAARFAENGWSKGLINLKTGKWNGTVRFAPHKLAEPLSWRKPCRVFVNSMTDLFHDGYTNEEIAAVFGVMAAAPQHTFQILTKRAKRMREWFEWIDVAAKARSRARLAFCIGAASDAGVWGGVPYVDQVIFERIGRDEWPLPNVWLGVSVENQEAADERIPELLRTPAAIRFLSCEPLLGPVDLTKFWFGHCPKHDFASGFCIDRRRACVQRLGWVIAGCESGPGARACDVAWLRSLMKQCADAGVPGFLKQAVATDLGRCGDQNNPNGDSPCGKRITAYVSSPSTASYSCGCTVEGPEDGAAPELGFGEGSKRKGGGLIELPYLDGVQHAAFPEVA